VIAIVKEKSEPKPCRNTAVLTAPTQQRRGCQGKPPRHDLGHCLSLSFYCISHRTSMRMPSSKNVEGGGFGDYRKTRDATRAFQTLRGLCTVVGTQCTVRQLKSQDVPRHGLDSDGSGRHKANLLALPEDTVVSPTKATAIPAPCAKHHELSSSMSQPARVAIAPTIMDYKRPVALLVIVCLPLAAVPGVTRSINISHVPGLLPPHLLFAQLLLCQPVCLGALVTHHQETL
jgi:hypothetical protein